jgi:antitoxin component YwqK of YwqJK toxin-antitoxin module
MKYQIFLLTILLCQTLLSAQSKKEIIKYRLKSKIEHKADYKDGNGKMLLDEVHVYDERGNVIKETNYDSDGKLKSEVKYFFNSNNLLESEEHYNAKEKLIKKIVYTYNEKGFKTSKKEFDGKGKLMVEKTYTYEYY